jgi:hypothetical protein
MATFKKTVKPASSGARAPVYSPSDTTRTFDARPKASDDRRREERARPSQHVDQIVRDPLDTETVDSGSED